MLFTVKNHLGAALLLTACMALLAYLAHLALGLSWRLDLSDEGLLWVLIGGSAIAASDGMLHGLLWLGFGDGYLSRYRALVEFFRPQGVRQILAGGALAASEELLFRGVLLEGLRARAGATNAVAVAVAAICFGICHLIPRPNVSPFTLWAIWEGGLLGAVYVMSDSLLVNIFVHALHDVAGFGLFALQRQTGWLLGTVSAKTT